MSCSLKYFFEVIQKVENNKTQIFTRGPFQAKHHFWHFKCHFLAFKMLLFWHLNTKSCIMKLEIENAGVWHLNAIIWRLVFMKLTPGSLY